MARERRGPSMATVEARDRHELAALLAKDAPGEEVYQLEISFFPLTRARHLGEED